jgi:hypothetical protein
MLMAASDWLYTLQSLKRRQCRRSLQANELLASTQLKPSSTSTLAHYIKVMGIDSEACGVLRRSCRASCAPWVHKLAPPFGRVVRRMESERQEVVVEYRQLGWWIQYTAATF